MPVCVLHLMDCQWLWQAEDAPVVYAADDAAVAQD